MKRIEECLNKLILPNPEFKAKMICEDFISFEPMYGSVIEMTDENEEEAALNELVKSIAVHCVILDIKNNKLKYIIDHDNVKTRTWRNILQFHILLWMKANNKVQFKRTKLSKAVERVSISDDIKDFCTELYLDAHKYGINFNTLKNDIEIKPIHKFFALKFESKMESE